MVSKYFEIKTSSEEFRNQTEELLKSLENKKVLIYDSGDGYKFLKQNCDIKKRLNIIGISDKNIDTNSIQNLDGYRFVKTGQIIREDFDTILITSEITKSHLDFLEKEAGISKEKCQLLFKEAIKDEAENYTFLIKNKFEKTLPKLLKRMKNKKVVLYGAGSFLELIKKYFDISSLDVIAIADKRFSNPDADKEFLGYTAISPDKIEELKPDFVLVSTKFYIRIIEDLHYNLLKNSKIKIKPLVDKSFMTLFKEIQGML